jgi:hypothetical protein
MRPRPSIAGKATQRLRELRPSGGRVRRVHSIRSGADHGVLGAAAAQVQRQRPGIDPGDPGDAVLGEIRRKRNTARSHGTVVETANDEARDFHPSGSAFFRPALGPRLIDAVVADVGIGHRDDLPGVGGVGEHLGVAGHRRVEDDLSEVGKTLRCGTRTQVLEQFLPGTKWIPERASRKDSAVSENKRCGASGSFWCSGGRRRVHVGWVCHFKPPLRGCASLRRIVPRHGGKYKARSPAEGSFFGYRPTFLTGIPTSCIIHGWLSICRDRFPIPSSAPSAGSFGSCTSPASFSGRR